MGSSTLRFCTYVFLAACVLSFLYEASDLSRARELLRTEVLHKATHEQAMNEQAMKEEEATKEQANQATEHQASEIHETSPTGTTAISKIIWYKLGPNGLSDEARTQTQTCIDANPEYRVEFLTDESAETYVQKTFAHRLDIVNTFFGLTIPIIKADLLRYMLLFDQGGVWSDLDVSCEGVTIDEWVPEEVKQDANLVVGLEFDVGWEENITRQFASWTIMARPGSPHMLQAVEDILEHIQAKMKEHSLPIGNLTMEHVGDIVDASGPRRMTNAIFKSLGKMLGREVHPTEIKHVLQPKMIGDVLVLPGRSFAASANTYEDNEEKLLPPRLVTHHYAGSWKNDRGGEAKQLEG